MFSTSKEIKWGDDTTMSFYQEKVLCHPEEVGDHKNSTAEGLYLKISFANLSIRFDIGTTKRRCRF